MRGDRPLLAEALFGSARGLSVVGRQGQVLQSVSSTMDIARQCLAQGVPDGYVVLAEHQSAGRGRGGPWCCPPGKGILLSAVLRLALPASEQKLVAILGAVAATEAVRKAGVEAWIKWPNDIVVASRSGGALRVRKLGGVLVERVARRGTGAAHILGIGLNVNQTPAQLPADAAIPATSVRIERHGAVDRLALCRALLAEVDAWYRLLGTGQRERLLARWRGLNFLVGQHVKARVGRRILEGYVAGLRVTGELILRAADGHRMALSDRCAHLIL